MALSPGYASKALEVAAHSTPSQFLPWLANATSWFA